MNVVVLYLISGQVIIGKLEGMILSAPFELLASPSPQGVRVSLLAFGSLFGALAPIPQLDLNELPILCNPVEAPAHLVAEYTKITTGIMLPTPNGNMSKGGLTLVPGA